MSDLPDSLSFEAAPKGPDMPQTLEFAPQAPAPVFGILDFPPADQLPPEKPKPWERPEEDEFPVDFVTDDFPVDEMPEDVDGDVDFPVDELPPDWD